MHTANGYAAPDCVRSILDKYVERGGALFVAKRIDLKNEYKMEIKEIERIYSEKKAEYGKLCTEINASLHAQRLVVYLLRHANK